MALIYTIATPGFDFVFYSLFCGEGQRGVSEAASYLFNLSQYCGCYPTGRELSEGGAFSTPQVLVSETVEMTTKCVHRPPRPIASQTLIRTPFVTSCPHPNFRGAF